MSTWLNLQRPIPYDVHHSKCSGSSTRMLFSTSDESPTGPPMMREDAKIIFGNIPELALFSSTLVERLEVAVGSALEGETGDDHVGALLLEIVGGIIPLLM